MVINTKFDYELAKENYVSFNTNKSDLEIWSQPTSLARDRNKQQQT